MFICKFTVLLVKYWDFVKALIVASSLQNPPAQLLQPTEQMIKHVQWSMAAMCVSLESMVDIVTCLGVNIKNLKAVADSARTSRAGTGSRV